MSTRAAGLTGYLLKEGTQQAGYRKGYRTIGGSIPLGELGGDRVILSPDLTATLLAMGKIEPYRRTNAKRKPKTQSDSDWQATTAASNTAPNVTIGRFGVTPQNEDSQGLASAA